MLFLITHLKGQIKSNSNDVIFQNVGLLDLHVAFISVSVVEYLIDVQYSRIELINANHVHIRLTIISSGGRYGMAPWIGEFIK